MLLACAVLVCNFGIIFESGYMQGRKARYQREVLATVTLLIIGSSLLYYFIVCWSEIVGALYPALRCNWLSAQRPDDEGDESDEGRQEEVHGSCARSARAPTTAGVAQRSPCGLRK